MAAISLQTTYLMTKGTLNYHRNYLLKKYLSLPFYAGLYRFNGEGKSLKR